MGTVGGTQGDGESGPWPARCCAAVAVLLAALLRLITASGARHYCSALAMAWHLPILYSVLVVLGCAAGVGFCIAAIAFIWDSNAHRPTGPCSAPDRIELAVLLFAVLLALVVCLPPLLEIFAWI